MRFPYSVVCALFAFPFSCDLDMTAGRPISTFRRAMRLLATTSGRIEYTDPGEKFENVTMLLFHPVGQGKTKARVRLFDTKTETELTEIDYFKKLRNIYNVRNPHGVIEATIAEETS